MVLFADAGRQNVLRKALTAVCGEAGGKAPPKTAQQETFSNILFLLKELFQESSRITLGRLCYLRGSIVHLLDSKLSDGKRAAQEVIKFKKEILQFEQDIVRFRMDKNINNARESIARLQHSMEDLHDRVHSYLDCKELIAMTQDLKLK